MEISKDQFVEALQQKDILRQGDIELLRIHVHSAGCAATPTELCHLLGKKHFIEINGQFGRLGKRIAQYLQIDDGSYQYWNVLAYGEHVEEGFVWYLKDELLDALTELGIVDETNDWLAEEVSGDSDLFEGAVLEVQINSYERNPVARALCIQHYGCACLVCGMNFEKIYGEIGTDFIHVHHLVELSSIGEEYKVDPVNDLRPVCPNCHAMLHRRRPAFTIEELKTRFEELRQASIMAKE
jgi:5-methylcytosine-specific restriction enzyme A